jgi:indolepyruvate ferredoxin oxidoreductase
VIPIAAHPALLPGLPAQHLDRVPEGSRALAGIGCHFMATWMNRATATFSHMGGEGAAWIGQAPFTERAMSSPTSATAPISIPALLAIRQAVAGGVNAHLQDPLQRRRRHDRRPAGGRQPDGAADRPPAACGRRPSNRRRHRRHRAPTAPRPAARRADPPSRRVGCSSSARCANSPASRRMIYDQTCAAEKRRRRKRGKFPDPARRVFINEAVCEGCGDCSAIQLPRRGAGGNRIRPQARHRPVRLQQGLHLPNGFCPSFVTVEGGRLKKGRGLAGRRERLRRPAEPQTFETKPSPGASSSPASAAPA